MREDWKQYTMEALLEMMERDGGICAKDLREGDVVLLTVAGQIIRMEVADPKTGWVMLTSTGPWAIFLHLTDNWGSALSEFSLSTRPHWFAPGHPLCIGPWIPPPVTRITLNGHDLTLLDGRKPS